MANKNNNKTILVERDTFEKNGKTYFSYFIKGKVRGKDVRVAIVPPDKGGYTVLDVLFWRGNVGRIGAKTYEIKDEATGKIIPGNSYGVVSRDENGEVYECAVKPFRSSDKSLLNMLLK